VVDNPLQGALAQRLVPDPPRARLTIAARRHRWAITALALVAIAGVLLVWARTRPGYDPYGWLVWGDQTWHLNLNLGGAPSWKPLPYLFTVPYALAGSHQLQLWMITAAALSLAGSIFAARIAYRVLTRRRAAYHDGSAIGRYAPLVGAILAGALVLALQDYMHYVLSAQSDPVIVTCCLAAIDCHLSGRYRWAFGFAVLGSLGRPEVWPVFALYALWTWFAVKSMRWMVLAGGALVAFMWFGIPWITNGRPDVAGQLALHSPRELHQDKIVGTISRFVHLQSATVWVAAAIALAWALARRDRIVLGLGAAVVLWLVTEIAFALHGFPALSRYMFEAGAVVAVLAGIGIGQTLIELPRLRPGIPGWAGIPIVVVLIASLSPAAVARLRVERTDLRHERGRASEIGLMQTTINELGGYRRIRACGEPVTIVEYASVLAWLTHLDVGSVGYLPQHELRRRRHPIVLLLPVQPGGWVVQPWHIRHRRRPQCERLHAAFVLTKQHPSGVLIR
jgi:hypothetical protein